MYNMNAMRSLFVLLISAVLFASGCTERPEVPSNVYGTILMELPTLAKAEEPFPFPMEGDNDHQNCVFDPMEF